MTVEDGVFERVIRADERAQEAHRRLNRYDEIFIKLEAAVNDLKVDVAKLNTKAGLAAAVGSMVGGAIVAAVVTFVAA